jgi:hypothetical protein
MTVVLLIGCLTVIFTMGIEVAAMVLILRHLLKLVSRKSGEPYGLGFDIYVLGVLMAVLFVGHLFQVAIWAGLFLYIGEFSDFQTAFYHSMVNYAALGYGDIVMSEQWRLLGALESTVGVLMFGLTAGMMVAVMTPLFGRHNPIKKQLYRSHGQAIDKDQSD